MKNTLTINHLNSGSVDLVNRVNSGTNEFLLEVTGGNGATITFDGGNAVSVTSDDFIYEVDSELWVGDDDLSVNISDGTISYTLTIHKIDQLSGDIYIQKDSATEFTLVKKEDSKRELLDFFYPVGCYFETTDTDFDPNITWGGTWELETEGLVHISSGENYEVSANDQDGGAEQITYTPQGTNAAIKLTAAQSGIRAHSHYVKAIAGSNQQQVRGAWQNTTNNSSTSGAAWGGVAGSWELQAVSNTQYNATDAHGHDFTGTQATLDNMQPYKIVNRWHRVA